MRLEDLLRRLHGVRPSGSGYAARCPAHEDREPSLSVSEGEDGRVLIHCHAGCSTEAVVQALGLRLADLMPEDRTHDASIGDGRRGREPAPPPIEVARYTYRDEGGRPLYQVRRYQPKTFRQYRREGDGWRAGLGGVRRVLYRLPEVLEAARAGRVVIIVEGEKDVDRLADLGFVATTCAMGAGKWRDGGYSEALRGAHVVILPDNDGPGRRHAAEVARSVYDVARSVRIVDLPDLPEKGDVSDWLDAGGTAEDLRRIIKETPALEAPPEPPPEPPERRQEVTGRSRKVGDDRERERQEIAEEARRLVLEAWTPMEVFRHHGRAGEVREERDGQTRLPDNGGLLIKGGEWYCHAEEVGGGAIEAWAWCTKRTLPLGGRAYWDVLREMADAKNIELPDAWKDEEHRGRRRTRDASRERPRESAPTRLCRLAKARFRFIRDVDGTPYLVGDDHVALPLRGAGRSALARAFYEAEGQGLTASTLSEAMPTLEAMAAFEGEQEQVHVRVARLDDRVYIDLGSAGVAVVEPGRWHVMTAPLSSHKAQTTNGWPVFTRPPGFLDLPAPVRGGRLDELGAFVRAEGDGLPLTAAWLIGALGSPAGYPLLVLSGPQGSGKSTTARLLRALLDPQTGGLTAPPREVRDLVVTAANAHIVALDNLSTVPGWLSDALCRLATGGGLRTRALYTDRQEAIFEARRPIILNGIPDLVRYADLADRSIPVRLSMIPDSEREMEADLWRRFEEARPRLLGALLDAVALGLARIDQVRPERLPRMADFAAFVLAAEEALPGPAGRFLEAYAGAQEDLGATLLDDPLAQALLDFVDERGTWEGTATDLHAALLQHAGHERVPHGWPKTPAALGSMLSRLEPPLLAAGVEIMRGRSKRARTWCLTKKSRKMLSPLSPPSPNGQNGGKNRDSGVTATAVTLPSPVSSSPSPGNSGDSKGDGGDSKGDTAAVTQKTAKTPSKTAIGDGGDSGDSKNRDFLGDDEDGFELRPIRESNPPF
ncbi:hypothetical protein GQ464_002355 [Rhodocaloribacter litoris]|uniref:hypothetical protein n=1 Tax=Rhodocaloribacter litoris TaxID=2558931 RepID=UPI0014225C45|nr:hypothetical protein [Rhodocaloribacter litoris]QXD15810.1 hypothetical protein GQ464_002355 [Rhodocaloribacter litoris]